MDFNGLKRKQLQQLCKKHGIPANLKNVEMVDRLSALFKRKQLQQLCKKHGIPANLKNVEMVDRLSALFKEDNSGKKRGRSCLKDLSVINGEEAIDSKDTKRVKFSPENETFVFEKTDPRERRLIARKGRGFRESRDEDDNSDIVKNVEIAEKEKPIIKNLRRRSIVVKPEQKSDSKIGDNANGRNLRRKSAVVNPHQIGKEKQVLPTTSKMEELKGKVIDGDDKVSEMEGLKRRSSRRKTMINGGFKAKDDEQSHGFEYSNGKIREDVDAEAEITTIADKIEESSNIVANWNSYEEAAVGSISDQTCVATDQVPDSRNGDDGSKPVARNLRRKSAVVKSDQMGEEKCMMPATSKMQKVKGEANDGDNKITESKGLKRSSWKTMINGSPKTMEVVRRSSRVERRMSKAEEQVVDDDEDHPSTNHLEMAAECVNDQEAIGCSTATPPTVPGKETVTVYFVPRQGLSDCKKCIVNEQCHGSEYSISVEKMADNNEEATEGSSNSAEKMNIINSTMPLEDCNEETEIIDRTHENIQGVVQPPINDGSIFHNRGDFEAGNIMVADRIEESSLSLNIVADGNVYEKTAITPPSIVKRQLCDTVLGSIADQTCVGEFLCHSTMEPSLPGSNTTTDIGGLQPSNCFDEFKGKMRNTKTLESSVGIECYDQSRNEQSILQESCCEGSPCLSSSPQIDTVEDKLMNCDAVIVEESDFQSAVGGEAARLWVSCDSIFREVDQTVQAFSADQKSSLLISQENVVLGPDTSVEANVQSPIDTEVLKPFSNISAATTNKLIEEGKDISKFTSLRNQGIDLSSNNAEDVHLVQLFNKDYTDDREDPSSTTSTFSLYLQSQVNGSIEKGVESCKETSDTAYVERSIQGESNSAEGNHKIVEQLDEVKVKLEFTKDDMNTFNEAAELQSEKTDSFAKQDAFGSSIEGGTPVLSKERMWSQVNVCPGIFSRTDNKTFEYVLGSNRDNYLDQCSVVAAKPLKGNVSSSKNNSARFEDMKLPAESHSASALSCLDVGSMCIEFSEHSLAVDTDTDVDKQESCLNDDNECADWKSIPEKDINPRVENLSDEYAAQTCELTTLSGSITEEGHKETSNDDLTCFMNDGNMNKVDENDKYVTAMEQENVSCFDEPEFQNLVFGNDKDDSEHSKELESKSVAWTTEGLLALGSEVEESVLFQKRKRAVDLASERSTLQYDVHCEETVSDPTKDLESVAVKFDVDDANINGASNVIILRVHNDSFEEEVDTVAQETGYAQEGVGNLGNESPKSTVRIDLDQAAGQMFTQQKEGSFDRATGEDADSAEKDNSEINCEREFGEEVQSKHAMQNSFLIVVSQKGGNDGENEMVEMSSTLAHEPGHSFEQGKDSDSFGMTSACRSPRRNSGKFSPTYGASVLNTDAESVVKFCPSSMDQKSTCYSATFGIASDCLHTSQDNKSNETLQHGDMVEPDAEKSDVLSSESAMPYNIKSQALVCEMDDGPESAVGKNQFESAGKKEMELQGLTSSSFSVINWKLDGARGNCEVDTETVEARSNMDSAVIEPSFFGEYEKEFSDIEKASESVPAVQTDSHLNAANMTRQENLNEQQEEDGGAKVNDDSASSRLEDSWPFDFDEVSDVNTGIPNKKSNNTEADVEFNVHEGNCFFGEPNINQDQMDVNMDSIDKGTCMADKDHLALEKSQNLESSPCLNFFIGSAPKHTVHSKSRCPDGKDNVTHVGSASNSPICEQNEIFDPSEEKGRDISVEDMLEPDAEESDILPSDPSESAMPDNLISQALVHEMDDGPESNAGENLVESADTKELELQVLTSSLFSDTDTAIARSNIDLGVMECPLFSEYENIFSDVEKTSEAIPEIQTDKHLNAANTTRQENVSEQQEEDAGTIGNVESASSRSEDLLPFDSDEVSFVNSIHANKKSINNEAEAEVNVDEGTCFFGELIINEDHMDVNIDCIDKDASMAEEDHLALEKSVYLESSPCLNFLFGSAPEHNVHSESRCPDGKDNVIHVGRASNSPICERNATIFGPSEEKVRDVSVGDMVEPDAEESDDLPSESAMPENIKSQALVHEIDDGPESNAGEILVEFAGTKEVELQDSARRNYEVDTDATVSRSNIDSALIESHLFSEFEKRFSDIEKASEAVLEAQTDNHLNAANTTRQENVSEQQDEDAGTNDNDVSASSRSVDLLPFDFDEVSDDNSINANKESINIEAEVEFNVDEGNCFFGEPLINQDHMDVNMDSIDKDACMAEGDHLASEKSENLECSPCAYYFMDSAPDYIVHSESRIPDGEDIVTHVGRASNSPICENNGMISDPSEEKVRGGAVGDIVAISKPEEHDEVAAEDFLKPCATIYREGNDSDSVDNKADVDSLSPYVSEKVIEQLQEPNYTPLMPYVSEKVTDKQLQEQNHHSPLMSCVSEKVSDKQINPTKSACQTALPDGENEVSKSEFVLTESEIELFWDEATKDELQTAAAEVTISSHQAAVEPEDCAPAPREQEQVRDNEKQVVGSVVSEVQGCCIGDNSEEKSKELETDEKVKMSSVIQRKNARSVLIHGTPKRQPIVMNDMKENKPTPKRRLQTVDATPFKPSLRRKALEDISK